MVITRVMDRKGRASDQWFGTKVRPKALFKEVAVAISHFDLGAIRTLPTLVVGRLQFFKIYPFAISFALDSLVKLGYLAVDQGAEEQIGKQDRIQQDSQSRQKEPSDRIANDGVPKPFAKIQDGTKMNDQGTGKQKERRLGQEPENTLGYEEQTDHDQSQDQNSRNAGERI